jgi:hypothetical protein
LGYKLDRGPTPDIWGRVRHPKAYLVFDNEVHNRGSLIETECAEAPPTTCLVLGDSFAGRLLPLFASTFRRCVDAYSATLDYSLVEEVRPDIVISVMNERFLIEPPRDSGAPTVREHAERKKAAGALRPPAMLPRKEPSLSSAGMEEQEQSHEHHGSRHDHKQS